MAARSARRGIGPKSKLLFTTVAPTKKTLHRLTFMDVLSANSHAFKPVVVLPGKKPHFRRVSNGRLETVLDYLIPFISITGSRKGSIPQFLKAERNILSRKR